MTSNYQSLFESAEVNPQKLTLIDNRVQVILRNKEQYSLVEERSAIPWWCVAAIHNLESSLNFHTHLHNGDPLTSRTVHVPRGRPVAPPASGNFPYVWYESALDALQGRERPEVWDLNGCLGFLERYNGLGYREHRVNSPYLWSFTSAYTTGLFVFDGQFSPSLVSEGIGAAALLKVMQQKGLVQLPPS